MTLTSPDGRFQFVKDSNGSSTATAYDTENGSLVGWNVLDFRGMTPEERQEARTSVDLLKGLHHSNILGVHSSWEAPGVGQEPERRLLPWQGGAAGAKGLEHGGGKLVYLTTPCTSLEAFVETKVEFLRWRVVKRWCRQVLEAVSFLHRQPTPIVHKKLGLGNVYIDPSTSQLFVGGVEDIVAPSPSSAPSRTTSSDSCWAGGCEEGTGWAGRTWNRLGVGRGDFEASGKAWDGRSKEAAQEPPAVGDVRACGNLFIEMILKKRLDPSLARDEQWIQTLLAVSGWPACAVDFLRMCRAPVPERPTADELLEHPFLELGKEIDDEPIDSNVEEIATEVFAAASEAQAGEATGAMPETPTLPFGDTNIAAGGAGATGAGASAPASATAGRQGQFWRRVPPPPPLFAPLNTPAVNTSRTNLQGNTSRGRSPAVGSASRYPGSRDCLSGNFPTASRAHEHDQAYLGWRGTGGWSGRSCSPACTPSCVSTDSPSPSSVSAAPSFDGVPGTPSPPRSRGLVSDASWAHAGAGGSSLSGRGVGGQVDDCDVAVGAARHLGVSPSLDGPSPVMLPLDHGAGRGASRCGQLAQLSRARAVSCSAHDAGSSVDMDPLGEQRGVGAAGDGEGGSSSGVLGGVGGMKACTGRARSASEDAVWDMLPSDERECRRPFTCGAVERRYG